VDWKYGIGDATRDANRGAGNPPALLFENVKGYDGVRVLTNALGSVSKFNIALGLDPRTSYASLVRAFRERTSRPVSPELLKTEGPNGICQASHTLALTDLPAPWWSREDAGRYLGTWHLNITKDPETGIRNLGVYRMQLAGPRTALVSVSPGSHLAAHMRKAEESGRPLEMAVAIGVDERLIMAAAMAAPYGTDEYSLAGGLALGPVRLRKCGSVDLEVPLGAEIVVEGILLPGERAPEGPFLDYAGVPKGNPGALVFEAMFLSRREGAIFRGAAIGQSGAEDHLLYALLAASGCLDFHGSRVRQAIQNIFLKFGWYRAFQHLGNLRHKTKSTLGKITGP
jgi:UbiD family decarboxylase